MTTPTTPTGIRQYDNLPPAEAVRQAWSTPGANPRWHREMRAAVRHAMPVLARALDRMERSS